MCKGGVVIAGDGHVVHVVAVAVSPVSMPTLRETVLRTGALYAVQPDRCAVPQTVGVLHILAVQCLSHSTAVHKHTEIQGGPRTVGVLQVLAVQRLSHSTAVHKHTEIQARPQTRDHNSVNS